MAFLRYPSLTQNYATKDIDRFRTMFGERAETCSWIITEKIHGANISFYYNPNNIGVKVFSRNNEITNSNFYNADDAINATIETLKPIFEWAKNNSTIIRLYGELFGGGIQKGVDYGSDKRIKFYDGMFNEKWLDQQQFENFFFDAKLGYMLVPKLGIVPKLSDALEFDTKFDSKLYDKEDNECEGIVIKPFDTTMVDGNGSLFYIKKKNEKFKEKDKVKKIKHEQNYSEEVKAARELFLSYINNNRIESVFSKEGEIQSMKEIGKFIPLIHKDALEDYNRDNPENNFTKEERKYIFNSSKHVVELLKEYL